MKKLLVLFLAVTAVTVTACSKANFPATSSTEPRTGDDPSSMAESGSASEKEEVPLPNSPADITSKALAALETLDTQALRQYVDLSDGALSLPSSTPEISQDSKELLAPFTESLTYSVVAGSETVGEDTANIQAEITNKDFSGIFSEMLPILMAAKLQNPGLDQDALLTLLKEKLPPLVKNVDTTVTKTVDIPLQKINGAWKVQISHELADALTGGMLGSTGQTLEELIAAFGGAASSK